MAAEDLHTHILDLGYDLDGQTENKVLLGVDKNLLGPDAGGVVEDTPGRSLGVAGIDPVEDSRPTEESHLVRYKDMDDDVNGEQNLPGVDIDHHRRADAVEGEDIADRILLHRTDLAEVGHRNRFRTTVGLDE